MSVCVGYVAYGPSSSGDIVPRYVGIGASGREKHCLPGHKSHNKIVESHKNNVDWKVVVEKVFTTRDEAIMWEIQKIDEYGRKDINTGTLFNQTSGGDGSSDINRDYMQTAEYKDTMSKAKAGTHVGTGNPMYGRTGANNPNFGQIRGKTPKITEGKEVYWKSTEGAIEKDRRSKAVSGKHNPNAQPVKIDGVQYETKKSAYESLKDLGYTHTEANNKIKGI